MRRHLPTYTSLVCFEASARHLSFTQAAEELNLTQSAVSRQVQNLEQFLRTPLFLRIKKRLKLTEEGAAYAGLVTEQLDILEEASLKLMTKSFEDMVLNLGTFTTFGSRWLIPKLADFSQQHPDIQVSFTTANAPFDFVRQNIDLAIQHGAGDWPNVNAVPLMKDQVIAVCAPELVAGKADDLSDMDVIPLTKLHLKTRDYAWPEWFEAKGLSQTGSLHGPQFETFDYMIRAARSGLGAAIVPTMYVEEELKDGRLVAPFGGAIESRRGYYLVTTEAKAKLKKTQLFSKWILSRLDS